MSVVIEALTLVISRLSLEVRFPDGSDAFIRKYYDDDAFRSVSADEGLVAISVLDPSVLTPMVEELKSLRMVEADKYERAQDFLLVDMETGPLITCDWLGFERHRHGISRAWHEMTGERHLSPPRGWLPQSSWALTRTDMRDDGPDRVLVLGKEDGLETVLDFDTGKVMVASDTRTPVEHVPASHTPSPSTENGGLSDVRMIAAKRVLDGIGVPYAIDREEPSIAVQFALDESPDECKEYLGISIEDARLRITVGPGTRADTLVYETVLPYCFPRRSMDLLLLNGVLGDARDVIVGEPATAIVCREIGTVAIESTYQRGASETWETAAEAGFAHASKLATKATIAFWPKPDADDDEEASDD